MIAQRDEGFFFVCIKSAIAVQCIPWANELEESNL
jgi:hypothetical protein